MTTTAATLWRSIPPLDVERLRGILRDAGSPLLAEADDVHRALGTHSAFGLAVAFHETKLGTLFTVPGIDASFHNAWALKTAGEFRRFATWAEGAREFARRMSDPLYAGGAYLRALTIREWIEVYAPARYGNDTERFVVVVCERVDAYLSSGGRLMLVPYPPFLDRPLPDKLGVGMSWGWRGRPNSTFWHTMVGWLFSTDAYFRMPTVKAATDWGIGGSGDAGHDGTIIRWLDYKTRPMIPWASGYDQYFDPDDQGQQYVDEFGYVYNAKGQSIELSGLVSTPVSAKQWRSAIWLTAAIHHHDVGQGWEEFRWNMHHREIAEKDCPFPRVYTHTTLYQRCVADLMMHFETGRDVEENRTIGGQSFVLPVREQTGPVVPPRAPIMVPFPRTQGFTVGPGGASARKWGYRPAPGDEASNPVVRSYSPGTVIATKGYYFGQEVNGKDRWLVHASNFTRIHESAFREPIPDPGALIVR